MRGRKKMNLRDVAIFVLFLVLFFMIFPPIFLSISDVSHGMSLWDSLNETTLDGLLLDWAVIIGIFVKCLLEGKGKKKNLYMTFGMNKRAYYKLTMKENSIKACIFAVVRMMYLFLICQFLDYRGFFDDYLDLIVYLPLSGYMIYMIIAMSKDVLDSIYVSEKIRLIREEGLTKTHKAVKRSAEKIVFMHVIISWIMCFAMHPDINDFIYDITEVFKFRIDWFWTHGSYGMYRVRGGIYHMALLSICFVITWLLYRKENLKKQDWIEG
ncbi:MAG: hypothetical protein IKS48_05855 [Eubacterium sp.]|nr:hypothetical protein [Eubacterium sp.]